MIIYQDQKFYTSKANIIVLILINFLHALSSNLILVVV